MSVPLTRWLLEFHAVRFSGGSGWLWFVNWFLSFWLCEEAKHFCLRLHLGRKARVLRFLPQEVSCGVGSRHLCETQACPFLLPENFSTENVKPRGPQSLKFRKRVCFSFSSSVRVRGTLARPCTLSDAPWGRDGNLAERMDRRHLCWARGWGVRRGSVPAVCRHRRLCSATVNEARGRGEARNPAVPTGDAAPEPPGSR